MKRLLITVLALLSITLPSLSFASVWSIDPDHSSAQFKIRHLMVSNVRGEFGKLSGTIMIDDKEITNSKVRATIDVSSINTGVEKRDNHLKADFFDAVKYPTITFISKKAIRTADEKFKIIGDITIHGITREVTLDVEGPTPQVKDKRGNVKMGASATTKISRKDFGLLWNEVLETGGVVVGDEVLISLEIEMVKKQSVLR